MTSINIITKPDVAYLFGDGASYDLDGVLKSITGKTRILSSISSAVIFMGRAVAAPLIEYHLDFQARDFDHLKSIIAVRLPEIDDHATTLFGEDQAGAGFRLFVAGWSIANDRPECFQISSVPFGDHPAYSVIVPRSGGWQSPGLSDEQRLLGFGGPPRVNADTIENVAITTLELQRQQEFAEGKCNVGGLVELVEVRRDRIDVRILKRWDEDRIGELIKPNPVLDWEQWRRDHPVNDPTAGMSRLQRDMYLRKQAKALKRSAA